MSAHKSTHTPLMQQYYDIKVEYPDALLFFQVGDFYELFFEDAIKASSFLSITLTARGKNNGEPIPLCGVPVHAKDHYVAKLVKGGFHVAICDQLEAPRPGTIVKRGVVQVLTPGTLTDARLLDEKSASYLFSFFPMENQWGLLFGELLTGQLFGTVLPADSQKMLESELVRFFPDEIVLPESAAGKAFQPFFKRAGYCTSFVSCMSTAETEHEINTWLREHHKTSVADFVAENKAMRLAIHYFYAYVRRNQRCALDQFRTLHMYKPEDFLVLDPATQRNLELVKNGQGNIKNTLFAVVDKAATPMGSRMIKKWLLRPLVNQTAIEQRYDVVTFLVSHVQHARLLSDLLQQVGDVERIIGRIALARAAVHDYTALHATLRVVPEIREFLRAHSHLMLCSIMWQHIDDFGALSSLLGAALNDDTAYDWIIKKGFDAHLDAMRELVHNSNEKIIALERAQQEATGIASLKIRHNNVHGYYIEITKSNMHLVPDYYVRQQTLAGKERYMIPALQELQHEIMRARNEIEQVEAAVFARVKVDTAAYVVPLRKMAHALANIDALVGFARVAATHQYVRPIFNKNREIQIVGGRNPIIESVLDATFIANDTVLNDEQSVWIITGPNMGGKSTYLRQVALNIILAQCGAFVAAQSANVALMDRVFTRIGAGDNLAEGKSTFLVEMEETATICTQATAHSLVILDEVGRGTSTFDGLAIAQAVVEHIHRTVQARCLFATHYHELTHLAEKNSGVVAYYAASKKTTNGIIFLYKMVRGVADGSFGIEVAKLAQLPPSLISRSQELLAELTSGNSEKVTGAYATDYAYLVAENQAIKKQLHQAVEHSKQLSALQELIDAVDYDSMSPKQAFDLLWQLRGK